MSTQKDYLNPTVLKPTKLPLPPPSPPPEFRQMVFDSICYVCETCKGGGRFQNIACTACNGSGIKLQLKPEIKEDE